MKNHKNKIVAIVASLLTVTIVTYFVFNLVFSPYWDSIYAPVTYFSLASMRNAESDSETFTRKKACEDIDYVIKRLKRVHPACIDGVPENVLKCAEREKEGFGDEVTAYELWRSCARVLSEMNDSNTMCSASFPLNYLLDYSDMLNSGCELEMINGVSVEEIFNNNRDIISYELEPWGVNVVRGLVGTREGLKYLGVYSDTLEYTYVYPDGSTTVKTYKYDDFYNYQAASGETADVPYSSRIDDKSGMAVMTLDSCVYDSDFREFVYDFFSKVTSNGIENVVIDLRENSGGTSAVLDEILIYLDHDEFVTPGGEYRMGPYMMKWERETKNVTHMDDVTVFGGNVYVLTSGDTFSSATLMAAIMKDNGFSTTVGEECGNLPQSYGDVIAFQTPNAAVTFQISSKYFHRVDESKSVEPLTPDITCGKYEAMETVEDIISKR